MLTYFVTPYPGETLHGIVERFFSHNYFLSRKLLCTQLFNNPNTKLSIDLPAYLQIFQQNVKQIWSVTPEQLLEANTIWPFYRQFVNPDRHPEIVRSMMGEFGRNIHSRVGINASSLKRNSVPMVCQSCVEEDLYYRGEFYFHRNHQIPMIHVCHTHNIRLSSVELPWLSGHRLIDFTKFNKTDSIVKNKNCHLLNICNLAIGIVENKEALDLTDYKDYLLSLGYTKGTQALDFSTLTSCFRRFYGKVLFMYGSNERLSWFPYLLNNPRKYFNPWQHLLVHHFIQNLDKKHRISINPAKLFGDGPWRCQNRASSHYGKFVITDMSIHEDAKSKRIVGIFKCNCGMIYSKSFFNNVKTSRSFQVVRKWGHVWHARLKIELEKGESFRSVGRLLGTDAKTISKFATCKQPSISKKAKHSKSELLSRRLTWKKLERKSRSVNDARAKYRGLTLGYIGMIESG